MAESAVIGALRVVLGADTGTFESDLKRAQSAASSFVGAVTKIAAGIGLERILEKSIASIVHSFKDAIDEADKLGKTAAKVGVPVEELSKLKLAADLADVSMESLSTGLGKLSKAMLGAAQGSADAEAPFKRLGVEVVDSEGKMRSATDVLADIAGKFETTSDGAVKTATAMQLFGKTGKDLIPLLNDGKHGLDEWAKAAQNMGLVISANTAAQSQKLMDNLKLLDAAKQGLVNTVMAQLLPALVRLSEQFVGTAKDGEAMRQTADFIVTKIKEMSSIIIFAAEANTILGKAFLALQDAGHAVLNLDFKEAGKKIDEFKARWEALDPALKGARKSVDDFFLSITVAPKVRGDMGFDEKLGKAIEDIRFKTSLLSREFNSLSIGVPEALKAAGVPIEQIGKGVNGLTGEMAVLNTEMARFQAAKFNEEALTSWQLYLEQLNRIKQAQDSGKLSAEGYQVASMKAATSVAASWGATAQSIVSPMSDAFKSLSSMNKQYAGVAKAAAIGEALVNTYLAATKALASVPPPFNYAAALAVTAAGLANVAKIQATQFATGGSFKVGGVGGIDSKLIQFRATPGEMVDIKRPGDSRGGDGTPINVTIHGESISRDQVRELFDTINSGMRDGYRLNLVA